MQSKTAKTQEGIAALGVLACVDVVGADEQRAGLERDTY